MKGSIFNEPIYILSERYYINYMPIVEMFIKPNRDSFHVTNFLDLYINDNPEFSFAIYRVEGEKKIKKGGKYSSKFFMISKDEFKFFIRTRSLERPVIYFHREYEEDHRYSRIDRTLLCLCSTQEVKKELESAGLQKVKEQIKDFLLGKEQNK
jgi:hypothetical protein